MSARSIRRSHERRGRRIARRAWLTAGAAAATAAIVAPGAQAANFPVSNLGNAGAGSLRNQIAAANASAGADTITFTGAATSGEIVLTTTEIAITDDLTITGPGAGQLAISGDADNDNVRDFATGPGTLGDNRIFNITDPTSPGSPAQQVTISGLTLREGVADSWSGSLQSEQGGAIYATDTALTLTNDTFTDNVATGGGGAVFVRELSSAGRLSATGSTFTNNRARTSGGAIFVRPNKYDPDENLAGTTIASSSFTGNRAGGSDFGGLLTTTGTGGALSTKYEVEVSDTTISGNTAVDGAGGAGYMVGYGTIQRSVIADNTAGQVGGGLITGGIAMVNSTVSGNTAEDIAGGLLVTPSFSKYGGGVARLDDSTVSGNSVTGVGAYSGYGGGIAVYALGDAYTLITRNSTIASNTAPKKGGGILAISVDPDSTATNILLKSTIVADNTGVGGPDDLTSVTANMGTPVSSTNGFAAGFSLIEAPGTVALGGDPAGSNIIGIDPKLSPLASNGGPTQTQAIAATSPAVDSAQANGFSTDQTGQPRTVDAVATNAPLSDGTDIGAFELQDTQATGGDPTTDFSKTPPKKVKLKGKKKSAKVKLKFSGTVNSGAPGPLSFECKVDKGEFTKCSSPLKLKLTKGKHTVEVRAVDSSGRVDSSPAKAKIKVKKAKKKK